ncbi:hypothetical protein Ddc_14368 [Ditylenchus destructor]|nr:hypothetical protein Ddc_14368 [Ditylenchus destructor]
MIDTASYDRAHGADGYVRSGLAESSSSRNVLYKLEQIRNQICAVKGWFDCYIANMGEPQKTPGRPSKGKRGFAFLRNQNGPSKDPSPTASPLDKVPHFHYDIAPVGNISIEDAPVVDYPFRGRFVAQNFESLKKARAWFDDTAIEEFLGLLADFENCHVNDQKGEDTFTCGARICLIAENYVSNGEVWINDLHIRNERARIVRILKSCVDNTFLYEPRKEPHTALSTPKTPAERKREQRMHSTPEQLANAQAKDTQAHRDRRQRGFQLTQEAIDIITELELVFDADRREELTQAAIAIINKLEGLFRSEGSLLLTQHVLTIITQLSVLDVSEQIEQLTQQAQDIIVQLEWDLHRGHENEEQASARRAQDSQRFRRSSDAQRDRPSLFQIAHRQLGEIARDEDICGSLWDNGVSENPDPTTKMFVKDPIYRPEVPFASKYLARYTDP